MNNLLISAAMGDYAGSAYEGKHRRTKQYDKVKIFSSRARFTDDTVLTFACAEAFIRGIDMRHNLWMCANQHPRAGYGHGFKAWMKDHDHLPYESKGNGSAMRCSSAGWLARTEEECIELATQTATPTHNHEEGIKGAVVTALCIYHLKNGADKAFIRDEILANYYPQWAGISYAELHDTYEFTTSCRKTVGPAIICFLESQDYVDCIRLAISLGADADTLAAISGPMAYAYYREMPDELVKKVFHALPKWMQVVNKEFDEVVNNQ